MRKILLVKAYIECKFYKKTLQNKKIWKETFINYFLDEKYGCNLDKKQILQNKRWLLKGFISDQLKLVGKKSRINISDRENPIVICVVKDELEKMDTFFSHYRKLGIKKFVMIDNVSSDGTLEFLLKQKDTDVYTVKEKFCSFVKEGWINQILALYGFNRWYLVVDADELLVWPQMKNTSLLDMLCILKRIGLYRPLAIMLDMYSDSLPYQYSTGNIFEDYCYCDTDTYNWIDGQRTNILIGGPRKRKHRIDVWLSKTPLFYLRPLDLFCCAHYLYPYQKLKKPRCPLVLLHYKFAYQGSQGLMEKYVEAGIDPIRILESKTYLRKKKIKFIYKDSMRLDNMEKLNKIKYVVDITKKIADQS